eukprot:scaffold1518_cov331-Pavlova_lutheri.AAC.45
MVSRVCGRLVADVLDLFEAIGSAWRTKAPPAPRHARTGLDRQWDASESTWMNFAKPRWKSTRSD